jgi:translation initiation factor 1
MRRPGEELVYSTDQAFTPIKTEKKKPGNTQPKAQSMPRDGVIRVARERRKVGTVTLIHGLDATEIDECARVLKKRFGGGGNVKDGVVILQGDHREAVVAYFTELGKKVKKAG